jgi:ABC-type Fe3+-hydroxamate transport system substrate-binding protein
MNNFIDQMGRKVQVPTNPQRIISLVPSQTELLADLGLGERVVGITKFCIHPNDWRKTKTVIGGTKEFKMDRIRQLKPDLIIGNKEENYQGGIEELASQYPVWMSDIATLADAMDMIGNVGSLVGAEASAQYLVGEISKGFAEIPAVAKPIKALYLIWQNPYMAAGQGTFIHELLQLAGFKNGVAMPRYPALSEAEIVQLQPEVILLSSEPFPFREKHVASLQALCPQSQVKLVDGELFSWYGSRLLKSASYLSQLRSELSNGL